MPAQAFLSQGEANSSHSNKMKQNGTCRCLPVTQNLSYFPQSTLNLDSIETTVL
jgi:hypothetical protein